MLLLAVVFAQNSFAQPRAGTEGGNGGDEYSKDFIEMGLNVLNTLNRLPIAGVDNVALLSAIQQTKVVSKPTLTHEGYEVDALNFPDPVNPYIEVSRAGWDRMAQSTFRRAFLVLHEYLGIMGVDDSQFHVSLLLDGARACPRFAGVRAELERRISKFCYDITQRDLHFLGPNLLLGNGQSWPAAELSQWDFAGLDAVTSVRFNDKVPVTIVRAQAFDFLPELLAVKGLRASEIEVLHPHAKLQSLDSMWTQAMWILRML